MHPKLKKNMMLTMQHPFKTIENHIIFFMNHHLEYYAMR